MNSSAETDPLSQALAEPTRRAILEHLRHGGKTVSDIVQGVQRKQPNVSNHLAKMKAQGLVKAERAGREIYYSLANPHADLLMRLHEAAHPAISPAEASKAAQTEAELAHWRERYLECTLAGREEDALRLANHWLALRIPLEVIYADILHRVMNEIGERYQAGTAAISQEHLASGITERILTHVGQFYAPMRSSGYLAVLGCAEQNWHDLGLRMLADSLREMGWQTLYLGANTPNASFLSVVREAKPQMALISCMLAEQWEQTKRLTQELALLRESDASYAFEIVVGGRYINQHPEVTAALPIGFLAQDLKQFRQTTQERFPAPLPAAPLSANASNRSN